jgi:hypothetical protein
MSPNVFQRLLYTADVATDVAASVLLQLCISGQFDEFWKKRCTPWCADFPLQAKDLLRQMFEPDAAERFTFAQVQQHHWLAGEAWPADKVKVKQHTLALHMSSSYKMV